MPRMASSMHLIHETSLLSTPLPFWTSIIALGKKKWWQKNIAFRIIWLYRKQNMHHISNFCSVKANCACSMVLSFLCLRKLSTSSSILAFIFWVFPSIRVNVSNGLLSGRVILWQLNCLPFSYLKVRKFQKEILMSSNKYSKKSTKCFSDFCNEGIK